MRKTVPTFFLLLLIGFLVWFVQRDNQEGQKAEGAKEISSGSRRDGGKRIDRILERVRKAAESELPQVSFVGKEDISFASVDGTISELDVMEVLLAVETEFSLDIPERMLNEKVGSRNRRNYLNHLSLSQIAECVDSIWDQVSP